MPERVRGRRRERDGAAFLVLAAASLLAAPVRSLDVEPGSFIVERCVDGVSCMDPGWPGWFPVTPCGNAIVYKNDFVRVTVTLLNNYGILGAQIADDRSPCPAPFDTGGPGGGAFLCPSSPVFPALRTSDYDFGNFREQNDPLRGHWTGQYWFLPTKFTSCGTPPVPSCSPNANPPDACQAKCGNSNQYYPGDPTQPNPMPITLVSANDILAFDNNAYELDDVEELDGVNWATMDPMPTRRKRLGAASHGAYVWAIGGSQGGTVCTGSVERFDPAAGAGLQWTQGYEPMLTPRQGLGVAASGAYVYAVGGLSGTLVLDTVERYEPGIDVWLPVKSLNTPRYGVAVVAANGGKLYAIGGFDAMGLPLDAVEEYDPGSDTWTPMNALPSARGELAATLNALNGKIYVHGGWDGSAASPPPIFIPNLSNALDAFDPAANDWTTEFPQASTNFNAHHGMAELGGQLYLIGGLMEIYDQTYPDTWPNALVWQYDPPLPAGTGANWVAPPGPMTVPRRDLAVVAHGGKIYAIGGQTGPLYGPEVVAGQTDKAVVTWTFRAEREDCNVDFQVIAESTDDDVFGADHSAVEGSFFDCPTLCNTMGDGTPSAVMSLFCGGTLCLQSPFSSSATMMVTSGPRPGGIAWIGDTVSILLSATNNGAPVTINSLDACAVRTVAGTISVTTMDLQGACGSVGSNPTSPVVPVVIPTNTNQMFVWTFTIAGTGTCGAALAPNTGGVGTFDADVTLFGKTTTVGIAVVPPPLLVTGTLWVDPDAGGAAPPMPLTLVEPGLAGTIYYEGRDVLIVRSTVTNASPDASISFDPSVSLGAQSGNFIMVAGPTPAGPHTLAPAASVTVEWQFARKPGSALETACDFLGDGSENFAVTTAARGNCWTMGVMNLPTPLLGSNRAAPPQCPPGRQNLLMTCPSNVNTTSNFNMYLEVTNPLADRPFILDAPGRPVINLTYPDTGSAHVDSGPPTGYPAGPPYVWAKAGSPGDSLTFTWTITAGSTGGTVKGETSLAFKADNSACHDACTNEIPLWDKSQCSINVLPPSLVNIKSFTVAPSVGCDNEPMAVAITIENLDPANDLTITRICGSNAGPEYLSNPVSVDNRFTGATPPNPDPPLGFVIPASPLTPAVNSEVTVTVYMDPICGPDTWGCFGSGTMLAESLIGGYTSINPDVRAYAGTVGVVASMPAKLYAQNQSDYSVSVWTDGIDFSVGLSVTVYFSVSNTGGNDLLGFSVTVTANSIAGGLVAYASGPTPGIPAILPGNGGCTPDTPPFPGTQVFKWIYTATQFGKASFTIEAGGTDSGCTQNFRSAKATGQVINIASEAVLECGGLATPLVTMSVSCTGCPPQSECDPVTGIGCVDVVLNAINSGQTPAGCVIVSDGLPANVFRTCGPGIPPAGLDFACALPYAPECAPPESDDGSCPAPFPCPAVPGIIPKSSTGKYTWRYSPTSLGCVSPLVFLCARDTSTGNTLYCDQATNDVRIVARTPLKLVLASAPAQIAPGQTFQVEVRITNEGDTIASLQGGEPQLKFFLVSTGANVTDQYDVVTPPPTLVQPGTSIVIAVTVQAHKSATPGAVEIRVPQGSQFLARDAETGLSFPAIDAGSPLLMQVRDVGNELVISGPNPTRIVTEQARITYQIGDAGLPGRRTRLKLYTLTGELVRVLVDKPAQVEQVEVLWDGRNDHGQLCASGIYLVRLEGPQYAAVRKLALIK